MAASDPNEPVLARGSFAALARWTTPLRLLLFAFYAAVLLYAMVRTVDWPLVWDATVFHYINLLTAHGMTPYRDIFDMNMPGVYMLDNLQMHVFGGGDLAWRLYEYTLLLTLAAVMAIIAWPIDWIAGVAAAVLFALIHMMDGPRMAGQRDELIAVLLMLGYAALYGSVRKRLPWLFFFYGLLVGTAISVKPTFLPLFCTLTLLALYVLKRDGQRVVPYALFTLPGVMIPAIAVWGYLAHYHAAADLLDLTRRLTAYYAGLMQEPIPSLLGSIVPRNILPLVAVAVLLVLGNLRDRPTLRGSWERWALWLGAANGALSYVAQRKGYQYHRYPVEAFLLLIFALECARVLESRRFSVTTWAKSLAAAAVLYVTLFLVARDVLFFRHPPPIDDARFMRQLEVDLNGLGGTATLQKQVQCLDMVDGCLGALFHLDLVQNTGFTGDTLFFVRDNPPAVAYYRDVFWNDLQQQPPKLIVVSDEWFNWERGYSKLDHWPRFAAYLQEQYTVVISRQFPHSAYRIYERKAAGVGHDGPTLP